MTEIQSSSLDPKPWSPHLIKRCSRCDSPFLDDFCEACGFRQVVKMVTGPDFYQLKDEYIEARSSIVLLFPWLERMFKKRLSIFLFKTKRRVKSLVEIMIKTDFQEGSSTYKTLHQIEFYDAIREIASYQGHLNDLKNYPEKVFHDLRQKNISIDSHSYAHLRETINTYKSSPKSLLWDNVKKYLLGFKLLAIALGALGIITGMAFYLLKSLS